MASEPLALTEERQSQLRQWFEQGIPFNRFLGMQLHTVTRQRCVLMLPWRDELVGDVSRSVVHGGVISTLIDTAGGCACFARLDRARDRVSTVDLRVDYLRPGAARDLYCVAEVIRMGNRVGVTRMSLWSGGLPEQAESDATKADVPVATGQGVYNIVRRD